MSIKVNHVTKKYEQQLALNDVSLEIEKGKIVGLLGPNGAGKSTLMKIITCFIPQTEGDVSVEGFDTLESPMEVRRRIGYLPEHNPLYSVILPPGGKLSHHEFRLVGLLGAAKGLQPHVLLPVHIL